jgi:hypothetical protein
MNYVILIKNGLGYILGYFSKTHPVTLATYKNIAKFTLRPAVAAERPIKVGNRVR